jgi:hypothetical protein
VSIRADVIVVFDTGMAGGGFLFVAETVACALNKLKHCSIQSVEGAHGHVLGRCDRCEEPAVMILSPDKQHNGLN